MKFYTDTSTHTIAENRDMVFSDLENGDVFQTEDGTLFLRIATIMTEFDEFNAVELATGTATYLYEGAKVAKYDGYIKLNPSVFVDKITIS